MKIVKAIVAVFATFFCAGGAVAEEVKGPEFLKDVAPIFTKYCTGCHNAKEPKGELILQTFAGAQKGGENGAVIVPGKADESRLVLVLEKKAEPFMPPENNKGPDAAEIAILRAWINAGAKGPASDLPDPASIVTPKITPTANVRRPINAAAVSPNGQFIAVARYGGVEILAAADRRPVATLSGVVGQVNDVGFSSDGSILFAAGGEPGLVGEATIWNSADWSKKLSLRGHLDAILTAELSPDGTTLATGSYDQMIKLWSTANGTELGELAGHNGAVFGVAFDKSGKLLASASGDKTVKLWDVAKRERLDTFNEPTEPQHAVVFSPDGRYVVAGGVDNRVRVWEVLSGGREGTNRIRFARFAHEGPVLDIRFSPDGKLLVTSSQDRTIKLWETSTFTQLQVIAGQPDWVSSLAFAPDNSRFLAGRLDGTLTSYPVNTATGQADLAKPIDTSAGIAASDVPTDAAKPSELAEAEPNDAIDKATRIGTPGMARGVFVADAPGKADVDVYRFAAKEGETWIVETRASQDNSPADTNIEVLTADGKPIERLLLRAIRDSYIEFRPIDSSGGMARLKNWEEMKMNQFLYLNGEVVKLFRAPRGPDSGWDFYLSRGKRHNYFDTSGTIHALGDPVYIVEPYLPGTTLVDNGLPVFKLNYVNDDDGERRLGSDSRVVFSAPADGEYVVRVTDVRGFSGADYKYALTIRRPTPDFKVSLGGRSGTVEAGSSREISVQLDRIDGFHGDVRVDITGMPAGFQVSTPIVVEAGHLEAQGVVTAAAELPPSKTENDPVQALRPGHENPELKNKIDWSTVKVTATAHVSGKAVQKEVENLGDWKVAPRPKYIVRLEPDVKNLPPGSAANEIVMPPGTQISATLRIERAAGFTGELRFDVNNLPHGVIVDDIGLSGVLVRENESERKIFLTADDWVADSSRLIHAISRSDGNEASQPVVFRIQRGTTKPADAGTAQASAK